MKKVLSLITIWVVFLVLWSLDFHYLFISNEWIIDNGGWLQTITIILLTLSIFGLIVLAVVLTEMCVKYFNK